MSCSRTSRPAGPRQRRPVLPRAQVLLATAFMIAGLLGSLLGCREELPEPTEAQVRIRFLPADSGLGFGARVYLDGDLIRSSLAEERIDTLLAAGVHTIVFRHTCVAVKPSDSLTINVEAGIAQQVDFLLSTASNVLVVDSNVPGLPIRLNGVPTGHSTPSSFLCMEPGRYEVAVPGTAALRSGFDLISGDTLQTVDVPDTGEINAFFDFDYAPRAQQRGVLVEVFTATLCPNCPKADEAADRIEQDPTFEDEALACVQVHLAWMGSDPFYTDEIGGRILFYGNDQSAPYVLFNGKDKIAGSSNPDLEGAYRSRILQTYGLDAEAGIYWSRVNLEGNLLSGDLRFVAIGDLTRFQQLRILAFVAKDSLIAPLNPYDVPQFNGVIRDLSEPAALDAYRTAGAYFDQSLQFDLEEDDDEWPSPTLRLVAFVQDMITREIIQCREVRVLVP